MCHCTHTHTLSTLHAHRKAGGEGTPKDVDRVKEQFVSADLVTKVCHWFTKESTGREQPNTLAKGS